MTEIVVEGLAPGRPVGVLRNVRLLDGSVTDVEVGGGATVDATGWTALPALAEPHAHLDKTLTLDRADSPMNSLLEAVAQWQEILPDVDSADVRTRAAAALTRSAAAGVTRIRTHVDLPVAGDPLRCVRPLLELRDALAGRMVLQVAALVSPRTTTATVEAAVAEGIDVLGGVPHLADDPAVETSRLLDVAERSGLPVDLHTDETLDTSHVDLLDLAEQVLARGLVQRVTASHCCRLSMLQDTELDRVLDAVARADIGIVALPQTNLFLQARGATTAAPRAIAPVRRMLDRGIRCAAGGDNVQDPFNAVGRYDPLETASLLVAAAHLTPAEALSAVTTGVDDVLGLPAAGPGPGAVRDLLLVRPATAAGVVAGPGDERVVLTGGRVLARTLVNSQLDLPALDPTLDAPPAAMETS